MKIINCKLDKKKFKTLFDKVNKYYGFTNWCNPIIHPDTKDIGFIVKDRILEALSSSEKKEAIEATSDWFPKPEII